MLGGFFFKKTDPVRWAGIWCKQVNCCACERLVRIVWVGGIVPLYVCACVCVCVCVCVWVCVCVCECGCSMLASLWRQWAQLSWVISAKPIPSMLAAPYCTVKDQYPPSLMLYTKTSMCIVHFQLLCKTHDDVAPHAQSFNLPTTP